MRRRIWSAALPVHRHSLLQFVADGFLVAFAYLLAFWLRFDGLPVHRNAAAPYVHLFEHSIWWVVPLTLAVIAGFGVYERLWTYVGQRDFEQVGKGAVVATLLVVGVIALVHPYIAVTHKAVPLPASVAVLFVLLMFALLGGVRFVVHLVSEGRVRTIRYAKGTREVLIVGAGEGGRLVVRELMRNPELRMRPVGFIDDDPRKRHLKDEYGLRVLGTTTQSDLERVLDEIEPHEVLIAIPSAPGTVRAAVVTACRQRSIPVRTTPTVFELLQDGGGQLRVTRQLREVRVEDILGREPVRMELERVGAYLSGRVVMVTGAGGSIGSELCRQIARVGPRKLVLVDHAEDNLFEIARELTEERHVNVTVSVLADCKEDERMREVLSEHRPAVIFHAAAYKHVAMMENNPVEAVRNNSLATLLMARTAGEFGVENFVLISTDKAVSPATVMGASKALAEWAVEAQAAQLPEYALRDRALRQRARLVGLGRADLPSPDRWRWTGDCDRRAHDPLLHDDPGGRSARDPRGLADRAQRRGIRARDGRADQDRRARRDDDPPVGPRARPRHRDRNRRLAGRREVPGGAAEPLRARAADAGAEDHPR